MPSFSFPFRLTMAAFFRVPSVSFLGSRCPRKERKAEHAVVAHSFPPLHRFAISVEGAPFSTTHACLSVFHSALRLRFQGCSEGLLHSGSYRQATPSDLDEPGNLKRLLGSRRLPFSTELEMLCHHGSRCQDGPQPRMPCHASI